MGTLIQDIRYGIRMLRKNPAMTLVATLTLAMGIGANTTIFSVVNGFMLRPLPVANADRLVVLGGEPKGGDLFTEFSYPDFQDIRSQADGFQDVFGFVLRLAGMEYENKVEPVIFSYVSGNFFSATGLKPAAGTLIYGAETEKNGTEPVAVLGYNYWKKRFNSDKSIIGKQVKMNSHLVTVVGVAPEGFHGTYSIVDMQAYLPLGMRMLWDETKQEKFDYWTQRDRRDIKILAVLKPGVSRQQATVAANVVAQRLNQQFPDTHKSVNFYTYPERLARPDPDPTNGLVIVGVLFMALAGMVLLLACSNVANIVLVRATTREREMAVRTALGAARTRIVRQLLTEGFLLALMGGVLGLLVGLWTTRLVSAIRIEVADVPLQFDFSFDWRVFSFALLIAALTGLVVGMAPAWRAARADFNKVLHEGSRGILGSGKSRMRNVLVVAQVAVSLVLLVVAGLFVRSAQNAEHTYLGFDPHNLVNFAMETRTIGYDIPKTQQLFRDMEERVGALPGVESVSIGSSIPMGYSNNGSAAYAEGQAYSDKNVVPQALYNVVDAGYFANMRIPVLRGRALNEHDTETSPKVAVINEAMAKKLWPNEDALGKRFSAKNGGPLMEVVGIAKQGRYNDPADDTTLFYYQPQLQNPATFVTLQVRTAIAPASMIPTVEQQIYNLAPGLPLTDVQTMDEAMGGINGFFLYRMGSRFTVALGLLGLVLALVGVYSVISYSATQKTHEIGVRMALGAGRNDILKMVLRQGFVLVGAGLLAGLVLTFVAGRGLRSLLVGVSPSDPLTLVVVTLLLGAVGLVASFIPARRAMKIEPLRALKYE
jgi:macrolide transport system ATP-binding/permease protein